MVSDGLILADAGKYGGALNAALPQVVRNTPDLGHRFHAIRDRDST